VNCKYRQAKDHKAMKYLKFIAVILLAASACKKEEDSLPRLSFSAEERNWFIYQVGQEFKFKSPTGDSIIFVVDSVTDQFKPEYKDPFTNPVEVDQAEAYAAYLKANDDFIDITFYKSSLYNSDATKLNQTIGWHNVAGQFIEIENIKNKIPFTSEIINNITYNKVSAAIPMSYTQYPWTKWNTAFYDQNSGFIELIDINGVYWERQ
jgi:hypothetical protein